MLNYKNLEEVGPEKLFASESNFYTIYKKLSYKVVSLKVLIPFYHCISLGHSRRVLSLARCVRDVYVNADIVILSMGKMISNLTEFENYEYIQIPALRPSDDLFSGLKSDLKQVDMDSVKTLRSKMIQSLMEEISFDLVITEFFPFARYNLKDEFQMILDLAKQKNDRVIRVSAVRDILETVDKNAEKRRTEINQMIENHFEQIWIHSEKEFLELDFDFSNSNQPKVYYLGYLTREPIAGNPQSNGKILIMSGGGKDNFHFMEKLIPFITQSSFEFDFLRGPYTPDSTIKIVNNLSNVNLVEFSNEAYKQYPNYSLVISMCGYNSFSELLSNKIPYLFLPREIENEQLIRCERLSQLDPDCYITKGQELTDEFIKNRVESFQPPSLEFSGSFKLKKHLESLGV